MRPAYVRIGGVAAVLVPAVLWGGGIILITVLASNTFPVRIARVFEEVLGAVAPLLMALAMAATWRPMIEGGWRKTAVLVLALSAVLLVCVGLYGALGHIGIFRNDIGTRPLQAAGAFAYAVAFALALLAGASLAGFAGTGQGLWRAAGVLYIVAGLLAAPSWTVLGAQIVEAADVTMRFTRDLGALLGLLLGTLLFLPIAALLHGLALLRVARAERARATSAA